MHGFIEKDIISHDKSITVKLKLEIELVMETMSHLNFTAHLRLTRSTYFFVKKIFGQYALKRRKRTDQQIRDKFIFPQATDTTIQQDVKLIKIITRSDVPWWQSIYFPQ